MNPEEEGLEQKTSELQAVNQSNSDQGFDEEALAAICGDDVDLEALTQVSFTTSALAMIAN